MYREAQVVNTNNMTEEAAQMYTGINQILTRTNGKLNATDVEAAKTVIRTYENTLGLKRFNATNNSEQPNTDPSSFKIIYFYQPVQIILLTVLSTQS